jgi:hypothetical protein
MDRLAIEQPVNVLGVAGVAAKKSVVTEDP